MVTTLRYSPNTDVANRINAILSGKPRPKPKRAGPKKSNKTSSQETDTPSPKPAIVATVAPSYADNQPKKPFHPFFSKKPPTSETAGSTPEPTKEPTTAKLTEVPTSKPKNSAWAAAFSSFASNQRSKSLATREAPFPWQGLSHVRGLEDSATLPENNLQAVVDIDHKRKGKGNAVLVPESEDVILELFSSLSLLPSTAQEPGMSQLYAPAVKSQILEESYCGKALQRTFSHRQHSTLNPMLSRAYSALDTAFSAFDDSRCETQSWTQKYAPLSADEILQPGREALVLREWLQMLRINSVDTGKKKSDSKGDAEKPKKKRKRPSELDGFIIDESEEEELDEFIELDSDSRSLAARSWVRQSHLNRKRGVSMSGKIANTVLLSGPNGCGKTAAVYAVAKELGFEIFEINPGSRRSGKDILDRIGNMTGNHLVQRVSKAISSTSVSASPSASNQDTPRVLSQPSTEDRQPDMASFFKPTTQPTKPAPKNTGNQPAEVNDKHASIEQKQSLILFEEVDILFDDDKQFWSTVLALAVHSKRPVILTCNDENVVPKDALWLHALLRFQSPEIAQAVDLMLLMAAHENHLLRQAAVTDLYLSKRLDLRASIAELQFWCQVGVRDEKNGLSWTIDRFPPGKTTNSAGQELRAMSCNTYYTALGWANHDILSDEKARSACEQEELLLSALNMWKVPVAELIHGQLDVLSQAANEGKLSLEAFEMASSHYSAMDLISDTLHTGNDETMDPTQPLLSDKARHDYSEGYQLLPASVASEFCNLSVSFAVNTIMLVQQIIEPNKPAITEDQFVKSILSHTGHTARSTLARVDFALALDPIAENPLSSNEGLTFSSFDREFRVIVEDIAPYVRAIAKFDMVLEAERAQTLAFVGGGRAKRLRTTRASRSALEGGRREEKRRDRWFTKDLNLKLVMDTGPKSLIDSSKHIYGDSDEMDDDSDVSARSQAV
jgi:DNA polymerase III delta prime subunit